MLYIVLIMVLGALGLLVAALVTSKSLFAWISIVLSILAAVALFADWVMRRRAERRAEAAGQEAVETPADEAAEGQEAVETPAGEAVEGQEAVETPAVAAEETAVLPAEEPAERQEDVETPVAEAEPVDDGVVPDEEETDAADLLIVCELDDQVIVVDEHPRYHLAECRWLRDRDTIPIAVSEARELGFTPCARCGPDARLAEQARRRRKASAG